MAKIKWKRMRPENGRYEYVSLDGRFRIHSLPDVDVYQHRLLDTKTGKDDRVYRTQGDAKQEAEKILEAEA